MLSNMKSNSKVGKAITETASIAYDGALLPAGTASYGSELWSNLSPNFRVYRTATENVQYVSTESMTLGKTYLVTVNITNSVGTIQLYPSTGGVTVPNISIPVATVGVYSVILTATATGVLRWIGANTGADMTISTISVKEVLINPNTRYLKNTGKDKTPALVESGQGKFFNGTNQYINTGIIPNQSQGTLVTRFTYVSGMVSRCVIGSVSASLWVNASGKIEGVFGDVIVTSTDTLITTRSYHVSLTWNGLVATLKVDNVTKAVNTATTFSPTNVMYLGARNNAGTPDRYFNNVIDETYYYDVALLDAQIGLLYSYPERVKAYNGAIVPDIGSEANCKLFLPLCENSGSNVVNVAVARGSNFRPAFTAGVQVSNSNSRYLQFNCGLVVQAGKAYEIVLDYDDTAYSTLTGFTVYTTTALLGVTITAGSKGRAIGIFQVPSNYVAVDATSMYMWAVATGVGTSTIITGYTVKEITAYPLANYTTAMHTSAAKLSYGAQCTAWKRDSIGVLLGMSNGLSFDGGVSVKPISSGYIPLPSEDWAIETIMYLDETNQRSKGDGTNTTGRIQINADSVGWMEVLCGGSARKQPTTGYHHIVIKFNTTTKTFNAWYDGVLFGTNVNASAYGIPTLPYSIGGIVRTATTWDNKTTLVQGTTKIHKGAQYAKFDIAKAWAKAQKTIAKLGA